MSRVYFHSPDREAELRGSERAHAGVLTNRLAFACLSTFRARERYMPLVDPASYVAQDAARFEQSFETWWSVGMDGHGLLVDGETVLPWHLSLNTALVLGSDAMILLARMHATCEIHGYVEGEHRGWLADIIEKGRSDNVLRPGQGWEGVAELLRESDADPVVMSYSVCDGFPNAGVAKDAGLWTPGPEHQGVWTQEGQPDHPHLWGQPWWDGDEWYDLSGDEQWRLGIEALRNKWVGEVDLTPTSWRSRGFGKGWSVFDLEAWIDEHPPESVRPEVLGSDETGTAS